MVHQRNIYGFYLNIGALAVLIGYPGHLSAADINPAQPGQPNQSQPSEPSSSDSPISQKWRKKKKKKPTMLQSWQKVVTLDWDNITPHDERNLLVSATCGVIVYSCWHMLAQRTPERPRNANDRADIINPQRRTNNSNTSDKPGSINLITAPTPPPLWADTTVTALDTRTIALPSIGQSGLTCGNHAFINTRDVLAEIAKNPEQILTAQQIQGALCTDERSAKIASEITDDHDLVVNNERRQELWRMYIERNIKKCIPHRSFIEILFSFWDRSKKITIDTNAITDLRDIIHDQTYNQKKLIVFSNESTEDRAQEITANLIALIDQKTFDASNSAINKRRKDACIALVHSLDLNTWHNVFSHSIICDKTSMKKAIATCGQRGRDLASDEIRMLVEKKLLDAPFKTEMDRDLFAKDDNDNIILDDTILDDQKIVFNGENGTADDMNGKVYIIERGIRTVIIGNPDFYLIKAVKKAYETQQNFCFGFILRETNSSADYQTIKTIDPDDREMRQSTLAPLLNERAEWSMTHWISVVLHRVNGVNYYYVTDSMDTAGRRNASQRDSIKILVEALETDNHY